MFCSFNVWKRVSEALFWDGSKSTSKLYPIQHVLKGQDFSSKGSILSPMGHNGDYYLAFPAQKCDNASRFIAVLYHGLI